MPRGRSLPIWIALKWAIILFGWPLMIPGVLLAFAVLKCHDHAKWARITRASWQRNEAARALSPGQSAHDLGGAMRDQ